MVGVATAPLFFWSDLFLVGSRICFTRAWRASFNHHLIEVLDVFFGGISSDDIYGEKSHEKKIQH